MRLPDTRSQRTPHWCRVWKRARERSGIWKRARERSDICQRRNPKEAGAPLGCSLLSVQSFDLQVHRCEPRSAPGRLTLTDRSRCDGTEAPNTRRCPHPTCPFDPHRPKPMRWDRSPEHPEVPSSGPNPSPGRLPGLKPAVSGFPSTPLPSFPGCGRLGSPLGSDLNIAPTGTLFKPDRWLIFANHESFSRPAGTVAKCTESGR